MFDKTCLIYALKVLNLTCQDPLKSNLLTITSTIFCGLSTAFLSSLMIYEIYLIKDLILAADILANLCAIVVINCKLYNAYYKKNNLRSLIKQLEEFWSLDKFGYEWQSTMNESFQGILKLCYVVDVIYAATAIYYLTRPFFIESTILPAPLYYGNSPALYDMFYGLEIFYISFLLAYIAGHDVLLLVLVGYAYCELRMLKKGFQDIPFKEAPEEEILKLFSDYVDHHNRVMKFIEDLNEVYPIFFLCFYFTTTFSGCMTMFVITASIRPLQLDYVIKFILYFLSWYIQMWYYCSSGSTLTFEAETVASAIYNSHWTSTFNPKIRKGIIMVIQRSQRDVHLSIGGMFNLGFETFTNSVKLSYSTFMLMNNFIELSAKAN